MKGRKLRHFLSLILNATTSKMPKSQNWRKGKKAQPKDMQISLEFRMPSTEEINTQSKASTTWWHKKLMANVTELRYRESITNWSNLAVKVLWVQWAMLPSRTKTFYWPTWILKDSSIIHQLWASCKAEPALTQTQSTSIKKSLRLIRLSRPRKSGWGKIFLLSQLSRILL